MRDQSDGGGRFHGIERRPQSSLVASLQSSLPGTVLLKTAQSLALTQSCSQMNEYVEAIQSVGSVLAPYDSDQLFPIWGFGARIPPSHAVSHCFPLTGSVDRPEVRGVEGMVEAYRYSLANVQLYGPTIFSQILTAALHKVKRNPISQEQQLYHILLIITVRKDNTP